MLFLHIIIQLKLFIALTFNSYSLSSSSSAISHFPTSKMAHFILFITGKHLHSFIPPLFFPSIVLKQWSYSYYPIPFCPVLSHFNATYNCIQSPAVADKKYSYHSFVSPYFAPECPVLQGIPGLL